MGHHQAPGEGEGSLYAIGGDEAVHPTSTRLRYVSELRKKSMATPRLLAAAYIDVGLPDLVSGVIIVVMHEVEVSLSIKRWLPGQR